MDEPDVPSVLRRTTASSARRLPPPLLMVLLDQLDDSAWFRDAALSEWEEADSDADDPRLAVSALFLFRPEGWEERVSRLVTEAGDVSTDRMLEQARREIARLERLVDQLGDRLDAAQTEIDEVGRVERAAAASTLARHEEARRLAERERDDVTRRMGEMKRRLAGRDRELAEADGRIDDLRRRIARRERRNGDGEVRGFGRGTPLETARDLDRLVAALRAGGSESPGTVEREVFRLPVGMRPDSPEAIDWLLAQELPVTVLVDGYNVAHGVSSPPDPSVRRRVEDGLVRLRRRAAGPIHVVVFWDSSAGVEQWDARGLDVRYVPDADAAIIEEAQRSSGRVVVVTSDAEIREQTMAAGAIALWSNVLTDRV